MDKKTINRVLSYHELVCNFLQIKRRGYFEIIVILSLKIIKYIKNELITFKSLNPVSKIYYVNLYEPSYRTNLSSIMLRKV